MLRLLQLIHFSGVDMGEACSVVLRGATQQILDEAERSLHDALCVLSQTVKDRKVVFGGGCTEMLMANAVNELAVQTPGKESMAIEGFATALRQVGVALLLILSREEHFANWVSYRILDKKSSSYGLIEVIRTNCKAIRRSKG